MAEERKADKIANNAVGVNTPLQGNFFRVFVEFLTPIHNLSNREKDILAAFLKERFNLSQSITDSALLDRILMGEDTKARIKKECNVSDAFFSGILGKLRKNGVIVNDVIHPRFIPKKLNPDDSYFRFMVNFNLK